MERRTIIILGFLFNLLGIFIAPLYNENISFGEVIFFGIMLYSLPAYALALLNGFLMKWTELNVHGKLFQITIGLSVLILLVYFANRKIFPLQFIASFGIFGIGITNLIWIVKLLWKEKEPMPHKKTHVR